MDEIGARFELGHLSMTPNARDLVEAHTDESIAYIKGLLIRHRAGDWGHVDKEDAAQNEWSLKNGERIVSAYTVECGLPVCAYGSHELWLITEADRSITTLLRPEDY